MHTRARLAPLAAAVVWLWLPARAPAQQPSAAEIGLRWRAPDDSRCPRPAQVRAALAAELGTTSLREPLAITADVARTASGRFVVRLAFRGAIDADRELAEESCDALAAASVWLSADVIRNLPPPEPTPGPPEPTPERPDPMPASAARVGMVVWGLVDSALLPDLAWGPAVELAVDLAALRLALRPRLLSSWRSHEVEVGQTQRGLRTLLVEAPVQACYAALRGRDTSWGGLCASAVPGLFWGSVRGAGEQAAAFGGSFGVEAALAGALAVSPRWRVHAELALLRPLWFPRFALAPAGVVHEPAALSLRAGFGLGLLF